MTRAPARDEHRAVQQALKAALRARVGLFEGRYCSPETCDPLAQKTALTVPIDKPPALLGDP